MINRSFIISYLCFGSKWGDEGTRILDVFLKYNIVFAGFSKKSIPNYEKYAKCAIGTKIAIKDGTIIKAVGETIEKITLIPFTSLNKLNINFTTEEKSIFNKEKGWVWVLIVKVKLYKLEKKDRKKYSVLGRIRKIHKENIKKYIDEKIKKYSGELAMEEYIKLLKNNYNLILTGAPGTGKTYLAKEIAKEMMKDNTYYKQFIREYYNKNKERLDKLKKKVKS